MKGLPYSLSRGRIQDVPVKRLRYVIKNRVITVTDPGAANAPFTTIIGGLPECNLFVHAALANFDFLRGDTNIIATFGGNVALGSAPTADATLAGAEVDLVASTALVTGVAGLSAANRLPSGNTPVFLNNTDASLEVNLNGFILDASITASSSLILNGIMDLIVSGLLDD